MKACWILGIAMVAGLSAPAQECTVIVYVRAYGDMPAGMLPFAELKSAAMFHKIGVEMRWLTDAIPAHAADDGCRVPIMIQLENTGRARVSPEALAFAAPFAQSGTCIHVLLDRLLEQHDDRVTTALLAHVLAHEITHVLERIDRHSNEGVMKARWTVRDRRDMEWHCLPFAAEDVELIHRGIAQRMLHAAPQVGQALPPAKFELCSNSLFYPGRPKWLF